MGLPGHSPKVGLPQADISMGSGEFDPIGEENAQVLPTR